MSHSFSPHARGKYKVESYSTIRKAGEILDSGYTHSSQPSKPGVLTDSQPCCLVISMLLHIIILLKVPETDVSKQHGEQHSQSKQAACKYDVKHLEEICTVLFALKARTPYAPWPNLFASNNIASMTS